MKAIIVRQFGGPEVLQLAEIPTPAPESGQVLVKIKGAGVNPADTYMRTGTYAVKPPLPYTPGGDGAGTIESIGPGVTTWKPGDRVYIAGNTTGTYAEYAVASSSQVYRLPDRISFSQGAGIHIPYATAYYSLYDVAHARPGETVLVHGASGGVGIAAVQIARAAGMRVIGTASSEKGRELVKREGAHEALDHKDPKHFDRVMELTGNKGANVIVEMLANVNLGNDLKILAQHGRVAVIGNRGEVQINARDLMSRMGTIGAMTLWGVSPEEQAGIHSAILAGLENGTLRPIVGEEIRLADAIRAHKEVMEHGEGAQGKIVLVP
jgi:NADPH2:quinone reductase